MRILIYGLLLILSSARAVAGEKENIMSGLTLSIKEVKSSGVITVEINNSSQNPIKIWKEGNSWGAGHWRVLLINGGRIRAFFQNPDQVFTRNFPAFNEIPARGFIDRKLDIAGEGWRRSDVGKIEVEHGDTLIVIYDVPKHLVFPEAPDSVEADKMGVWYGVVTTMTVVQSPR
jgi:hypothetical protein